MGESQGFLPYPDDFETLCIHHVKLVKNNIHNKRNCLTEPIILSNFVKDDSNGNSQQYIKGRYLNSTRSVLENLLSLLNRGKYCLAFSSGIGAISAVLGLLKSGDHIICSDDIYGQTSQLFCLLGSKFGLKTSFVDFCDPKKLQACITPMTKLFWIENPTNPRLKVIDLCETSKLAKEHNVLFAVDNSFLTPYLQRPLEFDVDITVQALTKFTNGHSDVIMGSVSTNKEYVYEKLKFIQTHRCSTFNSIGELRDNKKAPDNEIYTELNSFSDYGHVPSPFDCYQVIRGIKTLPLRLKKIHVSSLEVAKFLIDHPKIECVLQPAHPSHPNHLTFKNQTSGNSGMVSFYVRGGNAEALTFLTKLKIFVCAVSMGGYESLLQQPYHLSHKWLSDKIKEKLHITPNLFRMSIGLEDVDDLKKDLDQALNQI